MKKKIKPLGITWRVAIWYTLFIGILLVSLLIASFYINESYLSGQIKSELVNSAIDIKNDPSDFDDFDDGIYYAIYDMDTVEFNGQLPKGFIALKDTYFDQVYTSGNFLYYDTKINENKFLRAVTDISYYNNGVNELFIITLLLSPIILAISIYGGKKIMRKAFQLVEKTTLTANEIQTKGDFSKRIEVYSGDDEITMMAKSFNGMLDKLENSYNREKQFSLDVSHELRTPISVIISESQYALDYMNLEDESKESFQVVNRQAEKMKKLVNQIMDLAKIENVDYIEKEEINYSDLLEKELKDLRFIANDIEIVKNIQKDIYINGDRALLIRMVDNLLSNAFKFTKSRIEINLYEENTKSILEISNNGSKIEKNDRDKIFNRFYQADTSRNKEINQGFGLGLSFVKKIIDMHAGKIELISEENTTFRIII